MRRKQRSISEFFGPRTIPLKSKMPPQNDVESEGGDQVRNPSQTLARLHRDKATRLSPGAHHEPPGEVEQKRTLERPYKYYNQTTTREKSKNVKAGFTQKDCIGNEVGSQGGEESDVDMMFSDESAQDDLMEVDGEAKGIMARDQVGALDCSPDGDQRLHSISPAKRKGGAVDNAPDSKRSVAEYVKGKSSSPNEITPPGLEKGGMSTDSDDDSFADLREHERNLAISGTTGLRRSTRITKEVVRFDPNATVASRAKGGSVFGDSALQMRKESKSAVNALKAMVKERSAREVEERQIDEMKQDLMNGAEVLTEGEAEIRDAANEEDRLERQRLARMDKYASPVPLFIKSFTMPVLNRKYFQRNSGEARIDPAHDIFLEAWRTRNETSQTFLPLAKFVNQVCSGNFGVDLSNIAVIMFKMNMFDSTPTRLGATVDRDHLFNSLCNMARCNLLDTGPARLQTLEAVLEKYGAVIVNSSTNLNAVPHIASDASLEAIAESKEESTSSGTLGIATRNLKRMFLFSAERIRHGDKLYRVLSRNLRDTATSEAILHGLGLCTRVLLSKYGCRLHLEVGSVITALLERISHQKWPGFRVSAAKRISSQTTRLGLHADLVTSLLPHTTTRAQFLRLDTAYMSLMQWSLGPGSDPQWKDIQFFEPSEAAKSIGVEEVSYCVADIIQILQDIPELQKSTDDEWACRLSKVIRQTITDRRVLARRNSGEIGVLHQLIQKLRTCSHRMVFGVPVQDMRLALDATLVSVRELLRSSQSAQAEILPHAKSEMTQTLLIRPVA